MYLLNKQAYLAVSAMVVTKLFVPGSQKQSRLEFTADENRKVLMFTNPGKEQTV